MIRDFSLPIRPRCISVCTAYAVEKNLFIMHCYLIKLRSERGLNSDGRLARLRTDSEILIRRKIWRGS